MNASRPLTTREQTKANQNFENDPLVGTVLGGHYEILECIGKGGMSVVYRTRHQLINQMRAVKILLPHRDAAADFLLRFQLEATAASRMDNDHIVRIHDFVAPADSAPYLVMDFVDGVALGDEIDRIGRIPVKRSIYIFFQLLDALGHTHSRGVIHRDLKPDNILLTNDEDDGPDHVVLIDFGIAKLTAADKLQPQGLTPTGEIFGSPQYMSPEQCAGLTMDARSEIYSLGCMFYEMLCGRAPLLGKSVLETLNMQAHEPPIPLSKAPIRPPLVLPKGLDEIVLKCLAKKPDDRFQSTEELAEALAKIQDPSVRPDPEEGATAGKAEKITTGPNAQAREKTKKKKSLPSSGAVGEAKGGKILTFAAIGLLSFIMGFGISQLVDLGFNKQARPNLRDTTSDAEASAAELNKWRGLSEGGQKSLDSGNLDDARGQFEQAMAVANGLNDGQKHSAATSFDQQTTDTIAKFKTPDKTGGVDRTVKLSQAFPNHPWETKISALEAILKEKAGSAADQKSILRNALEVFEDPHKGNLNNLNNALSLAATNIQAFPNITDRDKLRLAMAIAAVQAEQGFNKKARDIIEAHRITVDAIGAYDPLSAKYFLLLGQLATREHDVVVAETSLTKAEAIYNEAPQDHAVEYLQAALTRSDIALSVDDYSAAMEQAKHALMVSKDWKATEGGALDALRNKLLMRTAALDPAHNLEAAGSQSQMSLLEEEQSVPKNIEQLLSALTVADTLESLNPATTGGGNAAPTRPMLWRAMALAYSTGHLADAASLMQPLIQSYDTPLTQKDRLVLASNKLTIDQALATAGNSNGPELLEDYITLGETLEDFSLGQDRDVRQARIYLEEATKLALIEANRRDKLALARFYYYQARVAREKKVMPNLVITFVDQSKAQLNKLDVHNAARVQDQKAAAALMKKVAEIEQETLHALGRK